MKLNPEKIMLDDLRSLWGGAEARLDDASMQRIANAAASVDRIVAGGETVYGVNTGFGLLANTRIPDDRLAELQTNLILSHSAGLGDPVEPVVKITIAASSAVISEANLSTCGASAALPIEENISANARVPAIGSDETTYKFSIQAHFSFTADHMGRKSSGP